MKYKETCECCGHTATAFTHNLNKTIIGAFIQFVARYEQERRPMNINKEFQWSHNQLANFRKLKFFNLIKKTNDNGYWVPTIKGIKFFYGEISVNDPVATMNGEEIPDDHPAWDTQRKKRRRLFISEVEETHYKQRPEYQAEKSGQLTIT